MPYSTLLLDTNKSGIALITLSRPQAANALNSQMAEELAACFAAFKPSIRAIVLTGAGKHFCAGADLKERKGMDEAAWEAQHKLFRAARDAILHCPVPAIAAVQGAAMAGGLELALACDFIYAADNARFALTEATLGIIPGLGGTQMLPRAIGERHARELLLTGRSFSAQEALVWGMVNRVCAPEQLMDEALATAASIAAAAPLSVEAIRNVLREGSVLPLDGALEVERRAYVRLIATQDRVEGINAFNEKRKPEFRGS